MYRALFLCLGLTLATPAWSERDDAPRPSPTTLNCPAGQVWDGARRVCVPIRQSRLEDDQRLDLAHELATFGRAQDALRVLADLDAPDTAEALTLRGYATRKAGDLAAGLVLYDRALALDPDHWQARAYLGAAILQSGDRPGAEAQLAAIRAAGGRGTFPEIALARVLATGGSLY